MDLFIILIAGLLFYEINGEWMIGSDPHTTHAKQMIDKGDEVMMLLHKKIHEKRDKIQFDKKEKSSSTVFGFDLISCAKVTAEIQNGETLLIAGGVFYYDASNDYTKVTNCNGKVSYECWTQIIADVVPFIKKYEPLTECYINNVYYTIKLIDYYLNLCIGRDDEEPIAPEQTFKQCVKDIKINF